MTGSDFHDMAAVAREMDDAAKALDAMSAAIGMARTIREYDSDRRRRALALAVTPFLVKGMSATAAEHIGRASQGYADDLDRLAKELQDAETAIAKGYAAQCKFDAARSRFSFQKSLVQNV